MNKEVDKELKWHSETWELRGKNFTVEIKHWKHARYTHEHEIEPEVNRWNVYAYIFPKHPIFNEINEKLFDNDIGGVFHCGLSYNTWKYDEDGQITCKQLGSDYQHLHDNYESTSDIYSTPCQTDAQELFEHLAEYEL